MAELFLSDGEVAQLTGYSVPAFQRKWLDDRGYPFEVTAIRKRPRVLRAYVEKRLGLASVETSGQTVPDFSRWKAA